MAFGNGSHSLKRGFLRPNGGSRLPAFLIISLVAGCSFLLYNVYITTVDRNSLLEELSLMKKKWQSCQRDKTELETRFETHVRSFKTMKDEVERLRTVERNSNEGQKELKQCREQVLALQNENADLKEEQKTDVESCQRKLKTAEEQLNPCMQDKSRLEGEINGLRSNLSAALQQAQIGRIAKDRLDDGQQAKKIADSRQPVQETDDGVVAPVPPHRGVPVDLPMDSTSAAKAHSNRTSASQHDEGNASISGIDGSIRDVGHLHTSVGQLGALLNNTVGLAANAFHEDVPSGKTTGTTATVEQGSKQTSNSMQPNDTSVSRDSNVKLIDRVKTDLVKKQDHVQNETDGDVTSAAELHAPADDEMKSMNGDLPAPKRRKQKHRRLNKERGLEEETRHSPSDLNKDRSRGEQQDESERVTLRAAIPNRINIGNRPGQPSDNELKQKDQIADGKDVSNVDILVTSTGKGGLGGLFGGNKDETTASTLAEKIQILDDRQKDSALAPPLEKPVAAKPKGDIRKGLKDDYQYRDDDEEGVASMKHKHKKAMANELDEVAEAKNEKSQHDGLSNLAKGTSGLDTKATENDRLGMKKEAKLAGEDEDLDKNSPKDADADLEAQN